MKLYYTSFGSIIAHHHLSLQQYFQHLLLAGFASPFSLGLFWQKGVLFAVGELRTPWSKDDLCWALAHRWSPFPSWSVMERTLHL